MTKKLEQASQKQRIEALYEEGRRFLRVGKYKKALQRFNQVLDRDSGHQRAIASKREAEKLILQDKENAKREGGLGLLSWWHSLGGAVQATIIVALITLFGTLATPLISETAKSIFNPPSATPTVGLIRQISSTEIFVNSFQIDTSQIQPTNSGEQINIAIEVTDTNGAAIPNTELACKWEFTPPVPQHNPTPNNECMIPYELPTGLDDQLVKITIAGANPTEVTGKIDRFINFTSR